jgi:hypothetical protein
LCVAEQPRSFARTAAEKRNHGDDRAPHDRDFFQALGDGRLSFRIVACVRSGELSALRDLNNVVSEKTPLAHAAARR